MNKVLFEKSIRKIKNVSVRKYFLIFFNVRKLLAKLILFLVLGSLILGISFAARDYYLRIQPQNVVLNPGVAFSFGANLSDTAVLVIQLLPVIITFILSIFLNSLYFYIPCVLIFFGGLSNTIDRVVFDHIDNPFGNRDGINDVVDYIKAPGSVFNFPDIFVVGGSVSIVVFIVIYLINMLVKESKNKNETKKQ